MPPPSLLPLFFLLALHSPSASAATRPSDVAALAAFKAAISPSSITSWSCLATWNFSASDPCVNPRTTHFVCGVACSPDATRVTQLVVDPAGYSGPISPLLSSLSALTHLDLSDNSFAGPIPSSLSALSSLQTLVLRSNSLSGPLPSSLSALSSLQTLDLSRNSLSGPLPSSLLSSLSALRILDLSFNSLSGPLPPLPPNLSQLAAKANALSGPLLESSFRFLPRLEVLELSSNQLAGALGPWIFLLPSIQQIDLANNSLSRIDVRNATSSHATDLVAVDLGYNRLWGPVPVEFATYPSLSALSLRHNRLHGGIPWQYAQKPTLRRLFLDGNFLIGRVPPAFFAGGGRDSVAGSFGDNCLEGCPTWHQLCTPSQKPVTLCKRVYGRKKP